MTPPRTNPNRCVLLTRVSTGKQSDSRLGLEGQLASMKAYCEREGLEIVSIHEDAGVSGRAALEDRPGLLEAMASVVSNRAGILLCDKLDRAARDPLTLLTIEKALMTSGAKLISVAGEGTDGDDPSSIFMRRIMSAAGEMEANLVSARTKAALAAKKARGERLGRPPKGFKLLGGGLVRGPDWGDVLKALELRAAGEPLRVVAAELGVSIPAARKTCLKWQNSPGAFKAYTRDVEAGLHD